MATKSEDVKVLEKVVSMAKRELDPVEYARFVTLITPKTGDSTKELRACQKITYQIFKPLKIQNCFSVE
jgi:hypothetical protein